MCDSNTVTNSQIQIKTNESGIRTKNFLITNNTLIDTYREGAIVSAVEDFASDTTKWVNNIVISGNTVQNLPNNTAFCNLNCINVVKIQDNTIESFSADTLLSSMLALISFPSNKTNISWLTRTNNCYNGIPTIALKYPSSLNILLSSCDLLLTSFQPNNPYSISNDIEIYPNPVSNEIYIRNIYNRNSYKYILLNNLGQILKKGSSNANIQNINISDLQAGAYFLRVKNDKFDRTFKVIKE